MYFSKIINFIKIHSDKKVSQRKGKFCTLSFLSIKNNIVIDLILNPVFFTFRELTPIETKKLLHLLQELKI